MITVHANNSIYRFSDDTPQDVMKGAINRHLGVISPIPDDNKPAITPTEPIHEEAIPIDEIYKQIDKTPIPELEIPSKDETKPPVQESKTESPILEKPSKADIMNLQADIQSLRTALSKVKTRKAVNRLNKEIKERETELEKLKTEL